MSDNSVNSLKRLKEISKMIEATLNQNNRVKNIMTSEIYLKKKCEAALETVEHSTDEQECFKKVSKIFIRKSRSELKNELKDEIAEYDKHYPYLAELRKRLVDKLSNLKEQYVQAHDSMEKEANNNS
ncbi:hypothetical protein CYL21_3297 [Plasmodium falciparum NF54]|uniref:Mediator of RNA polymerase II transcription subunit 11, putative n=4 Tax=Plasmodium falciparum TaxID=5833 RepID=C0H4C7_PLAF7|nr:mediator of RNA polymerase II transcription subunit 11, putative [Plasmodium falciparum 3D7]ETW20048.1 hypothetical protein PFFVO_00949 [Plasmodium falciparum Vietnam Oak-Knoll (FVO)]ETW44476.1 hypothetical protein PFNF135_01043 [Plasmodium falciparum NF135/5.C10]KAF4328542.1 hypothetical protein CYL21_3297 [Plasmodium falciparum NF54]SOS76992.1 conserved Plasmodium protein, unknown function [Plasmodium sp. gorilla clade G1]PKC45821.1 hypothetical protein CK202_3502 [Plasmodium falciparum N|eukprot:XP_002808678.1 conserved Plasmodium protein, unknown function [Plasmodium falciparum 3D7]